MLRIIFIVILLVVTYLSLPSYEYYFPERGNSVESDDVAKAANAAKALQPLVDQGNVAAQGQLGWSYIDGPKGFRDTAKGITLLNAAANNGDELSQFRLGLLNLGLSEGFSLNPERAFEWFLKSQNYKESQFNLGVLTANGLGARQDYVQAITWFKKAFQNGDDSAKIFSALTPIDDVAPDSAQMQYLCSGRIAPPRYDKRQVPSLVVVDRKSAQWGMLTIRKGEWHWIFAGRIDRIGHLEVPSNLMNVAPNYYGPIWSGVPKNYDISPSSSVISFEDPEDYGRPVSSQCHLVTGPPLEIQDENLRGPATANVDPSRVRLPITDLSINTNRSQKHDTVCNGLPCLSQTFSDSTRDFWPLLLLLSLSATAAVAWTRYRRVRPAKPVGTPQPRTAITEARAPSPRRREVESRIHPKYAVMSRQLSEKAKQAFAEMQRGALNSKIVGDLRAAAIFGDADAALILGRITLSSKTSNNNRRLAEGLAWLTICLLLESGQKKSWAQSTAEQLRQLRKECSSDTLDEANALAIRISNEIVKARRSTYLRDPN